MAKNKKKKAARPGAAWKAATITVVTTVIAGVAVAALNKYLRFDTPRSEASPAGGPLKVDSVKIDPQNPNNGAAWIFTRPPHFSPEDLAAVSRMFGTPQENAWWLRHGAILPGLTIRTILRGNAAEQVRISDMTITPHCAPLPDGAYAMSPSAGEGEAARMGFDLHDRRPYAHTVDEQGTFGGPYFQAHGITLNRGETIPLTISVRSGNGLCRFSFAVETLVSGRKRTVRLDDNGRPFAVAGTKTSDGTENGEIEYAYYREVYAGGLANDPEDPENPAGIGQRWIKVDPKTYGG